MTPYFNLPVPGRDFTSTKDGVKYQLQIALSSGNTVILTEISYAEFKKLLTKYKKNRNSRKVMQIINNNGDVHFACPWKNIIAINISKPLI